MIDFTYNPIIPADYKSRGRGLPYEASPLEPPLSYAIKASQSLRPQAQREVNIKGESRCAGLPFEGVSPSYP